MIIISSMQIHNPPWRYKDKGHAGKRGASYKYSDMSLSEICNLPVKEISSNDCALFLWVTMPMLSNVFIVMEAWGFKYKTCAFTWIKKNKKADSFFWGMGNFTRSNAELCLLATKGKPKRVSAKVHSVVYSPIEKHSKKPDEVRNRIVELMGDKPRVELFAREDVSGWDSWGDEV
jgi:N6-adenosine-specific RNA methylase IME4